MVDQEIHKHETHAHSQQAKPSESNTTLWVGFIITLLVVAVASYAIGFHIGSGAGSQPVKALPSVLSSNSSSQPATTVPQSVLNATPAKVNVSASSYFMTPSDAMSFIGSESYSAYAANTPTEVAAVLSGLLPPSNAYTVSGEYLISYNTSSKTYFGELREFLLVSKQSPAVYSEALAVYGTAFNLTALQTNNNLTNISAAVNLTTASGMKYSFSAVTSKVAGTNEISKGIFILGYTSNVTVFAQLSLVNSSLPVNQSRFAAAIAGHLN